MEEVEATIYEGDKAIISGITVLLDTVEVPEGEVEGRGWHAHAALPLGIVLEPGDEMRLEIADGRTGPVVVLESPEVEGERALYEFVGVGPLMGTGV